MTDDSSEETLSKATIEENKREELKQEEEADEEEEHTEQEDEGEMDVDDAEGETDEGEEKCLRSGVIADRSESRSYGSVTHKCEVREAYHVYTMRYRVNYIFYCL